MQKEANVSECIVGFSMLLKAPFLFGFIIIYYQTFYINLELNLLNGLLLLFLSIKLIFLFSYKTVLTPQGWAGAFILGNKRIYQPLHKWDENDLSLNFHLPDWGIHLKLGSQPQLAWGLSSNYKNGALYVLEHANKENMELSLLQYLKRLKDPNVFKKKPPKKKLTKNQIKSEKKRQ